MKIRIRINVNILSIDGRDVGDFLKKMLHLFALLCYLGHLVGVFGVDEVQSVSVMEGDSVTLNSDLTEVQRDDEIQWMFGDQGALIALIDDSQISLFNGTDGRFTDRLKLDHQTGSLTINNIRTTDSGLYQQNIKRGNQVKKFNVNIYSRLPVPVISRNSSQNSSSSSSSSSCSLVCSVLNVSHVTLSWYKGNSLLSNISVSDLSISLSLPLEIQCLNDSYSCVVSYSFTNQTTDLYNTELCHTCAEIHGCGFTEAVIRLVIAALVGVAAVTFVVYDIRSRNAK